VVQFENNIYDLKQKFVNKNVTKANQFIEYIDILYINYNYYDKN